MTPTVSTRPPFWLGCLFVIACGGGERTPGDRSTDDASSPAPEAGPDGSAPDEGGITAPDGAACPASIAGLKTCRTNDDCVVALVPACCGMRHVVGIASASAPVFDSCNPAPSCMGLGCASSSFVVPEQGVAVDCGFLASTADCVNVACVQGECTSESPPSDAGGE